jgi:hypothetical protein
MPGERCSKNGLKLTIAKRLLVGFRTSPFLKMHHKKANLDLVISHSWANTMRLGEQEVDVPTVPSADIRWPTLVLVRSCRVIHIISCH